MCRRLGETFSDRPYYATRTYVLGVYRAGQNLAPGISVAIAVLFALILFLSGLVQSFLAEDALTGGSAIVLLLVTVLGLTFLIAQPGTMLLQQPVATKYIERCAGYLSRARYDKDDLNTIEKMAQNDAGVTQVSTSLSNIGLGVGLGVLFSGTVLKSEQSYLLIGFVVLIIPLTLLANSRQDYANVVIRQAVALQMHELKKADPAQSKKIA